MSQAAQDWAGARFARQLVEDEHMQGYDYEQRPPVPAAPPTAPGELAYARGGTPSNWPTVIGIIAIVLGILGILGGLWGMVAPFVIGAFSSVLPSGADAGTVNQIQGWRWWLVGNSLAATGIAVVLLRAGIGLAKRRPWARTTALTWAWLRICLVLAVSAVSAIMQHSVMTSLAQQDPTIAGMGSAFATGMGLLTLCVSVLWGWAFPVFMLIWLYRRKIRAEMAGWTAPASPPTQFR